MAWACSARAVVAMQLAAWSLAGVLLLHRGLSTLAKDSQQHAQAWRESLANRRAVSAPDYDGGLDYGNATLRDGADNSTLDAAYNAILGDYETSTNVSEAGAGISNATAGGRVPPRKMRTTALVYVALGLLVLAVGPAIVAFKSCDERTRPAFQKVSTQAPEEVEAPPSYESAVGEPAPRYSTLFGSQVQLDMLAPPPLPPPPPPPPAPPDACDDADPATMHSTALLIAPSPQCCDVCRRDS